MSSAMHKGGVDLCRAAALLVAVAEVANIATTVLSPMHFWDT
jgi:hypothetical protein